MEDPWAADQRDAHRALGSYIAEFSRLVFGMRLELTHAIAGGGMLGGPPATRAEIALGGLTAEPISSAFFAICRDEKGKSWDDEERRIADKLEESVIKEIQRRNDYAHGDWFIGFGSKDGPMDAPGLRRTKPQRKSAPTTWTEIPTVELDRNAREIFDLRQLVLEFGDVCLALWQNPAAKGFRVRDVFEIVGKSRRAGTVQRRKDTKRPGTRFV